MRIVVAGEQLIAAGTRGEDLRAVLPDLVLHLEHCPDCRSRSPRVSPPTLVYQPCVSTMGASNARTRLGSSSFGMRATAGRSAIRSTGGSSLRSCVASGGTAISCSSQRSRSRSRLLEAESGDQASPTDCRILVLLGMVKSLQRTE
jgi:hypothetical protein